MKFSKFLTTLGLTTTIAIPQIFLPSNTSNVLAQDGFNLWASTGDVWEYNANGLVDRPRVIPVCWENSGFNTEKNWVKWATEATWERVSSLNFTGWGNCSSNSTGIRIQISDTGPHTKGLGDSLNGVQNGMVLNFTFNNWSTACQDGSDVPNGFTNANRIQSNSHREFCIKAIAVHEFGHALGFAHEQNRPDTPKWCDDQQGSNGNLTIGAWDVNSVMNYCNSNWNGGGNLSATDIQGVQQMYGTPFAFQTGTGLHETDSNFDFDLADWDRDGKLDLVAVKKNGTSSTEVHILSGSSNYQRFILQTGTALHRTDGNFNFKLTDWDRDGKPDLVAIKKNGTNSTEVHILSGSSNYQQFILQTGTGLHRTDSNFNFDLTDWDRDGKPDLVAIKKNGTNSTEVHILSGSSNYQQFILQTGTGLHQTGSNFDFGLADWNRDGIADLIAVKKNQTGTNSTEVHILSGSSNFRNFILHTGTALHETGSNFAFVLDDWDRDGFADLFAVKKSQTGTRSTEVHVVSAASYR
jgi:hypothetical protein